MTDDYWSTVTSKRIGRRRMLALTGGSAAAAAFLAACGGDDEPAPPRPTTAPGATGATGPATGATGPTAPPTSSLLTSPEDSFAQAVRGGVLKEWMNAEPNSLDPINPQADLNNLMGDIYSTLLVETPGKLEPAAYTLQGDLAESWEVSPDGLQITFKVRQGAKWHPLAPVNSRAVDAEDVVAALTRHASFAPLRDLVWNEVSGSGFALTPEATDASTVVVKLAEPVAYAPNWFASFGSFTGQVLMFPKEALDPTVLDVRQTAVGTGPFYIKEHVHSVRFTLARNEDYWDQDFALVDEIALPIVPEYIARQGQFKAGEILTANRTVDILRAEDVLLVKQDQPDLQMYQSPFAPTISVITFGWQGEDYFKDERVRQAFSMAYDRDLDIEVRYNVAEFEEQGLPVTTLWNSHLGARDSYVKGGWFLDPQSSEFGENAKYFQHNVSEAKALLSAAGYPDGFSIPFAYPNAPQFNRQSVVEPLFFYFQQLGIDVIDAGQTDYTQDYIPNNRDASGAFEGLGYHSVTGTIPSVVDPTSALVAEHLPSSGVTFHGYSLGGGGGKTGDPALVEILEKAKIEQDVEVRKQLTIEAQRYLGKAQWSLLEAGGATGFWLAWPAVKSFAVWQGQRPWRNYQIWIDTTEKPFA